MGSDDEVLVLDGSASKMFAMQVGGSEFNTGNPYFFKYLGTMIWNSGAGRLAEESLGFSGQASKKV